MDLPVSPAGISRIRSVDILRGAIMVLMAIDHVRVYSGVPAGGPEPGVFFTRWVTHFCAPGFVFFAGTSAFLYGKKRNNTNALSRFLLSRGLLLIVLELTLIRFCWTFNFDYAGFTLAGVIWMLGCCMVLMALLVKLKPVTAGIAGLVIIAVQQVFAYVPQLLPQSSREAFGKFWEFIYTSGLEGPQGITILYVIVPWIGVMAAGYAFGMILQMEPARRNKICLRIGLSAIVLFLIIGSIIVLNKPASPDAPPFVLRLLNQNKYPASQLYLLMTLGPLIALVPFAEKAKGWMAVALEIFGKVPMFYYLLHIPLIHISALVVNLIRTGNAHSEWYNTAPYVYFENENDRWGLGLLYLVFIINVALLYFLCRWYAKYKAANPGKRWLRYV
jgi:uncharacterized membrane protein